MSDAVTDALIVLVLMVFNGVFAAAEISVLSVRKTRLAELAESGSTRARAVQWLRGQPERFLATVQIGITVIGTTAAAFGGDLFADRVAAWLRGQAPWLGDSGHHLALALVIALISFLGIVIGELVPKSLALRHAERLATTLGPLLRAMASLVRPVVWALTSTSNLILRLSGNHSSFSEARLSPEELQELVEEAARVGSIDRNTGEIASRAIDFRTLTAVDVMVPREGIVSIDRAAGAEAVRAALRGAPFARLPVYEGTPENITGYVAVKDLLLPALDGEVSLDAKARPVRFVPASEPATQLLREMQSERQPMVIVIDERGGLVGLVTVEDLLEELVGEILSEGGVEPPRFVRDPDGSVALPGSTPIRDLNRALDIGLPEPPQVSTVAGLCILAAKRLPRAGERFRLEDGHTLEVLDASTRRVRSVRLYPPAPQADARTPMG
ncbi:MAG: hemolysin family protein [Polyangiales bacterium]